MRLYRECLIPVGIHVIEMAALSAIGGETVLLLYKSLWAVNTAWIMQERKASAAIRRHVGDSQTVYVLDCRRHGDQIRIVSGAWLRDSARALLRWLVFMLRR